MEITLIKNGILLIIIGTLSGFPYLFLIKKDRANKEQWRIVHIASIMSGLVLIALASSYSIFRPNNISVLMSYLMIIGNWLFTFGMIISGLSGQRGLSFKGNKISSIIAGVYTLASLATTISAVLLIYCIAY